MSGFGWRMLHPRAPPPSLLRRLADDHRMRRIGLGDATRQQVLIDRTLAEVAGERSGGGHWCGCQCRSCASSAETESFLAGTLLTAELALQHGLACNTAGGTHHAFPDFGSGFCILNDLAIAAEVLLARGAVQRVLILDLDVHQVG